MAGHVRGAGAHASLQGPAVLNFVVGCMAYKVDISETLLEEHFDQDVVAVFQRNKIYEDIFLQLNQDDFKELGITALGDRIRLNNLKKKIIKDKVSCVTVIL